MRFASAFFAMLLVLGVLGCGQSGNTSVRVEPTRQEAPPAVTPETTATEPETPAPEPDVKRSGTSPRRGEPQEPEITRSPEPDEPEQPEPEQPAKLPGLIDFSAVWCAPCKTQEPIVKALEHKYAGRIDIRTVDVDENRELAGRFKIRVIPTLVFLDTEGNELFRRAGLYPEDSIVARFKQLGFID